MSHWVPELLAPAGSLEKLKVAVLYGADAVYLGGQKFGLRSAADNLTYQELEEGVEFAHERGAKVFVVLNSFLHDKDLDELPEFIHFLNELKVDAVIISDLGVVRTFRKLSSIPIHLSTQASCLNKEAARFWKKMGVSRIVLGREVNLHEAAEIKKETGLEINEYNSYGIHYSNTLKIWRDEFYKKWSQISKQGFDLTFKRMWNFYLSYCEAGFKSKNIDLIQFSLSNK